MIRKPIEEDLEDIKIILSQWTEVDEVNKYIERTISEINGIIEYNTRFWVYEDEGKVVGVAGLSDPLLKVMYFSKGTKPIELKILYLDDQWRGKGVGKQLMLYLENLAKEEKCDEMIIRSAIRYEETAYGFYEKLGYKLLGYVDNDMAVFGRLL